MPIGAVAKSFGVSENTIRRIEAAGLMKPALVISGSGYRYYDSANIAVLTEIFELKSFGFVYDDIREYFQHPDDSSALYEKLLQKQAAITVLADRFRRRVRTSDDCGGEIVDSAATYCFCREALIAPSSAALTVFARELLYETIQETLPIDYVRPLLVMTECAAYWEFRPDCAQKLTFCVPLSDAAKHPRVRLLPGFRALRVPWELPVGDADALTRRIGEQMERRALRQDGTIRLTIHVGSHIWSDSTASAFLCHVLLPATGA